MKNVKLFLSGSLVILCIGFGYALSLHDQTYHLDLCSQIDAKGGTDCNSVYTNTDQKIAPLPATKSKPTAIFNYDSPIVKYAGKGTRVPKRLVHQEFNMQDLIKSTLDECKTKEQLDILSQTMKQGATKDFYFLAEVSRAPLTEFVRRYLENYDILMIEGNDSSNRQLAVLINKDLAVDIDYVSNMNAKDAQGSKILSRDAPVAVIKNKDGKVLEAVILEHEKSKRNDKSGGGDDDGSHRREAQTNLSVEILKNVQKAYPGKYVMMAVGDFNNDLTNGKEFHAFREAGMKDAFDVTNNTVPKNKRFTQYYFDEKGQPRFQQFDGFIVNDYAVQNKLVVSAKIMMEISKAGKEMPLPQSYKQRKTRGSDHAPVELIIDLEPAV